MAFARKKRKISGKIYVLISDGECQEGTTWESLLIAAKHKLDNLVLLIDYNKIQALTKLDDALPLNSFTKKLTSFNWNCLNIKDGHSFQSIIKALTKKEKKASLLQLYLIPLKAKVLKNLKMIQFGMQEK